MPKATRGAPNKKCRIFLPLPTVLVQEMRHFLSGPPRQPFHHGSSGVFPRSGRRRFQNAFYNGASGRGVTAAKLHGRHEPFHVAASHKRALKGPSAPDRSMQALWNGTMRPDHVCGIGRYKASLVLSGLCMLGSHRVTRSNPIHHLQSPRLHAVHPEVQKRQKDSKAPCQTSRYWHIIDVYHRFRLTRLRPTT